MSCLDSTIEFQDWRHYISWPIGFLDRLQSDFAGNCPRIDLCITGEDIVVCPLISPESILDALAGSTVLMNLVKQGSVIGTPIGRMGALNRAVLSAIDVAGSSSFLCS